MAFLIEKYAGAFPLWLSPVQVKIVPIGERQEAYAQEVFEEIRNKGIRVELDQSGESLGKKIRNAKLEKIPYTLVIGDKEVEAKTVTIEHREKGNIGAQSVADLISTLSVDIANKS
jgi:threonyl-tRNA synthetase